MHRVSQSQEYLRANVHEIVERIELNKKSPITFCKICNNTQNIKY